MNKVKTSDTEEENITDAEDREIQFVHTEAHRGKKKKKDQKELKRVKECPGLRENIKQSNKHVRVPETGTRDRSIEINT